MDKLLKVFNIYHEKLDSELKVIPGDPEFWDLIGIEYPQNPLELDEVFPEVVGVEEDIKHILDSGVNKFMLPSIWHNDHYMHLSIFPGGNSSYGYVAVEDVSAETGKQLIVTQKKNEITLLKKQIEKKNMELVEVNKKLDLLMNSIRKQNHFLDVEVKKRTKELNDSRSSIITTLAMASEFRDKDTGGHIYRIGRSAVLIGKNYGLSGPDCELLFYSSLLHDLGKIGIPDSILLKPGPLSEEEWVIMRTHTTIGGKLLGNKENSFLSAARDVALHHHERWDGNGYPEGLSAEKIPIFSRICSIVDVFDALLSTRPYKKSLSPEVVVEMIVDGSGTEFDPSLIESFKDVIDDLFILQSSSYEDIELLIPEFDSI